jgi:hypothetical protein
MSELSPVSPSKSALSDFWMLSTLLELIIPLAISLCVNAELSSLSPTLAVSMLYSTDMPELTYYVRLGLNLFFLVSANLSLNLDCRSIASSIRLEPRFIDFAVVVLLRISESDDLRTFRVRMRDEFKLLFIYYYIDLRLNI